MANTNPNVVAASVTAPKLADGIVDLSSFGTPPAVDGCRVFTHYNGPTDQLDGLCVGMCVLEPGTSPHPPHTHPEEEFMIVASGSGEIECAGKVTQVGSGSIMYCAGNVLHGIKNTGNVPMTFYWSKWLAKGFRISQHLALRR
jgi:mannose-6-phosphate isomerase-like protein (cupin superfamily)